MQPAVLNPTFIAISSESTTPERSLKTNIKLSLDVTYLISKSNQCIDNRLTNREGRECIEERKIQTPAPKWRQALQIAGQQLTATPATRLNWNGLFYSAPSDKPTYIHTDTHRQEALNFTALLVKRVCWNSRFIRLTELINSVNSIQINHTLYISVWAEMGECVNIWISEGVNDLACVVEAASLLLGPWLALSLCSSA